MGGVSSALDPARGRGVISVPDGYTTPSFPSLYIPTLHDTLDQRGVFLYEAEAIWHFTFYWTFLLLGALFLICSILASFTIFINIFKYRANPPDRQPASSANKYENFTKFGRGKEKERIERRKKPPLWPIFILPLISVIIASAISLISGTVVGFALAAIYSAGGFSMSTWVPFLWALIQVLVLIISSYSTLTSIL
ncbi:uncharacterized protein I206_107777 [Kwoniella pini CBS 10737]|uniref:Integral membrane protein n=1 Tax=Kwoniella pini CBS 10737 TaxID=1296096 RepID=A0A1B9HY96_9TREE|nr:uncharacterized protein I206_06110 [Kwoniella pini CBS 10737]OCF48242.1 hypothetical protein I206_06110 [Kwoniella pini CBS 10737]